jgi:UPF0755 protein
MPKFTPFWGILFAFALAAVCTILLGPPRTFPTGTIVEIPSGATINEVGAFLAEKNVVEWPTLFSLLVRIGSGKVVAGEYVFSDKENLLTVAYRLSHGENRLASVKVTLPEGITSREMGERLLDIIPGFNEASFIALAKPSEGYLFPDTYFFLPGTAPEKMVAAMRANFDDRTKDLAAKIAAFGKTESDVIIMASILEKEGRQSETRRTIAGILWKRLALGMPLQVDAPFGYIFNTDTYSPKGLDFEVDSPYNTYKYKGLPPGPIDNPGYESIEDALTPISTPYLYYLTDSEGNIYYAKTYQEHLANKAKVR